MVLPPSLQGPALQISMAERVSPQGKGCTMSTVNEYHTYARDCLRWANRARTEEQRKQFLSLARDWTESPLGLEGVPVPGELEMNPTRKTSDLGIGTVAR